jgi:hypothetical protein
MRDDDIYISSVLCVGSYVCLGQKNLREGEGESASDEEMEEMERVMDGVDTEEEREGVGGCLRASGWEVEEDEEGEENRVEEEGEEREGERRGRRVAVSSRKNRLCWKRLAASVTERRKSTKVLIRLHKISNLITRKKGFEENLKSNYLSHRCQWARRTGRTPSQRFPS